MVAASYVHDVEEDTDYKVDELGPEVKALVVELTNPSKNSKEPRDYRKWLDRKHLAEVSQEAKIIKLIDRIDNLREVPECEFRKKYAGESRLLAEVIGDADPDLKEELLELCTRLEK